MKLVQTTRTTEQDELWTLGLNTIKELETEKGILASGKEEIYGCIFGRDSLITALKLLKAYQKTEDTYFLQLVKKILTSLADLQGENTNIESGEERGKIIHEYREKDHEHLTARGDRPWYVYSDNTMRNYDSVDSTPLFLIALSRYYELSHDEEYLEEMWPKAEKALGWLTSNMDCHELSFASYEFSPDRKCGGLLTQSWMDSHESLFQEDGSAVLYPIAPVEVQNYAHVALCRWARHAAKRNYLLSWRLQKRADKLKKEFNKHFIINGKEFNIAYALDGSGRPLTALRSSAGHLLWISLGHQLSGFNDSVLEPVYIPKLVSLLMSSELFVPEAGIRTLTTKSAQYDPRSYHNGSIWPHDTAIIAEGLDDFGYGNEARQIRQSLSNAWEFFKTPVELFVYDSGLLEYCSEHGQKACSKQAWSAASMLSEL